MKNHVPPQSIYRAPWTMAGPRSDSGGDEGHAGTGRQGLGMESMPGSSKASQIKMTKLRMVCGARLGMGWRWISKRFIGFLVRERLNHENRTHLAQAR